MGLGFVRSSKLMVWGSGCQVWILSLWLRAFECENIEKRLHAQKYMYPH